MSVRDDEDSATSASVDDGICPECGGALELAVAGGMQCTTKTCDWTWRW